MSAPNGASSGPGPYRMQFGAGYSSYDLGGGAQSFAGPHFEFRIGQHFPLAERHSLFLNGLFRYGHLASQGGTARIPGGFMSALYMGLEGGYEFQIHPEALALHLDLGLGSNLFDSSAVDLGGDRIGTINNSSTFALSLGGGISVARGIIHLFGAWQPNFGLNATIGDGPPIGFNPMGWMVGGAIDFARLAELMGGRFNLPNSIAEYFAGLNTPRFMVYGDYTGGRPNSIWRLEGRTTLYRPSDEQNPLGFGLNMALGYGRGRNPSAPTNESLDGFYVEFEEAYGTLRFPVGRGVLLQGGRFFILGQPLGTREDVSLNFTGLEDHETPVNNQLTRGHQFYHAMPLSFGAFRLQTLLTDRVMLSLASLHNFGSFFGPEGGAAAYSNVAFHPVPVFSGSVTAVAGSNAGEFYSVVGAQGVICLPATPSCQITSGDSHFNLGMTYYWGQQAGHHWHSPALYMRGNFIPQLGVSTRAEVFADPDGVRTGVPENLFGLTATLHVEPLDWLQFRAEIRQDWTTATPPGRSLLGADTRTTYGFGAAIAY